MIRTLTRTPTPTLIRIFELLKASMSKSKSKRKQNAFVFLLMLLAACAGAKLHGEPAELQTWVGTWRGVAIIENTAEPITEWSLRLTEKNRRLSGHISSVDGKFTRVKIKNVALNGYQLSFTFSFETSRGLQATQRHAAMRQGHKLLSLFSGREGGRAFRGKWEAKYEPSEPDTGRP